MKSWSIGEVARLLGVKPHVIRYWESELPLLSPRKSLSGRREYSSSEIRLLLRFRHLLYEKKFTVEREGLGVGSWGLGIRIGLSQVKSISDAEIDSILAARGQEPGGRESEASSCADGRNGRHMTGQKAREA